MGLLSRSCLVVVVVVLLAPAALALCEAAEGEELDPCLDDCANCEAGNYVPNPDNCNSYYVCIDDAGHYDLPLDCPDGEVFVFNSTHQECMEGDSCPCDGTSAGGPCVYECPTDTLTEPENIPAFADCSNYYRCETDGTTVTPMTCDASAPFFDGTDCQADETRCCHCHAYCYTGDSGGYIADPLDCHRYYLCLTDNENPTISGTCPDEETFDSFLRGCSASASCDTQCTNVLGTDGCIEPFTCLTTGFFARCPGQCTPDYYHCTEATGEYQESETCNGEMVFHPDSHTCVSEEDCP